MLCGRQVLFLCAFTHKAFDFGFCFVKSFACFEYFKHHLQQLHELEIGHFVHVVSFPALASLCRAVSRDASRRFDLSPESHHQAGLCAQFPLISWQCKLIISPAAALFAFLNAFCIASSLEEADTVKDWCIPVCWLHSCSLKNPPGYILTLPFGGFII